MIYRSPGLPTGWENESAGEKVKKQTEAIEINEDKDSELGFKIGLPDLSLEGHLGCLKQATIVGESKGSIPTSGDDKSSLVICFSREEESMSDDSSDSGLSS